MTPPTAMRILTGITTSGTPHLGNYVGAIRPAIAASRAANVESFYFLADYHALVKISDPARVQRSTLEIAASWLACGLDPERVWFYRQSDIPEIPELTWLLTCVVGKGLLNRAHAYKAAVDRNIADGNDPDAGVTAGLFMYPVLMAADILLFNANKVPVGRDQVQHIEMARDIAARFNHLYGEHFALPQAVIERHIATLPGLDGRKMSKSYDNTIPLFASRPELRKLIASIVTDSSNPSEPKNADDSAVLALYQAFASAEETHAMRMDLTQGMSWGNAKQKLFERIDAELAPFRELYANYTETPKGIAEVERLLRAGAVRARVLAAPLISKLRESVGLRDLRLSIETKSAARQKSALPQFKQYREADGKFYFKVIDGDGTLLFISKAFNDGRLAAQEMRLLGRLALGKELEVLTEGFRDVPVPGGYRFEIRGANDELMYGTGPAVPSAVESASLCQRFLAVVAEIDE